MRVLVLLGFMIPALGCGDRKDRDERPRWADLSSCLLGEPLAPGETAMERLRRIELGAPDDDWPERCAPYAKKLDVEVAAAIERGALPGPALDALWKDAPDLAGVAAGRSVPAAPAPGPALTRRMLPGTAAYRWADVARSGDEVKIVLGEDVWRITGGEVEKTPHGFDPAGVRLVPAPAGSPIRLMVGDRVVSADGTELARRGELWNTLGGGTWAVADASGDVTTLEGSGEAGYTVVRWPSTRTALPKRARWAKLGRDFVAWIEGGALMMRRLGGEPARIAEVAEPSRLMNCGAALYDPGARVFFPAGVAAFAAPADVDPDCADGAAVFGWRDDDGLHRLRCTAEGCAEAVEPVPRSLPEDETVHIGADRVVWRDDHGDLRIRAGGAEQVIVDGSLATGIRFDEMVVAGDVAILWDGARTYVLGLDPIRPLDAKRF